LNDLPWSVGSNIIRVRWDALGGFGLVLVGVAACGAAPEAADRQAQARYTCCAAADVETVYRPGQAVSVHWTVVESVANPSRDVVLQARLAGPYRSVDELKAATSDSGSAYASLPVRPTGAPGEQPVSTIPLGVDARAGYYNLVFSVVQAGWTSGGASVVRVAA
jgi:hypothetical protein